MSYEGRVPHPPGGGGDKHLSCLGGAQHRPQITKEISIGLHITLRTVASDISKSLEFYILGRILKYAHFNKGGFCYGLEVEIWPKWAFFGSPSCFSTWVGYYLFLHALTFVSRVGQLTGSLPIHQWPHQKWTAAMAAYLS